MVYCLDNLGPFHFVVLGEGKETMGVQAALSLAYFAATHLFCRVPCKAKDEVSCTSSFVMCTY